jgi:hypothetical protein
MLISLPEPNKSNMAAMLASQAARRNEIIGLAGRIAGSGTHSVPAHDPEKWHRFFEKDHAQTIS